MKETKSGIQINIYNFDDLVRKTVQSAAKLTEYFRMKMIYYQLVSGKGLEFDRVRKYTPGMDPRRIDWKIYARTKELFVRSYKEERQFDIIVAVDVSNSMLLGTTDMTKNEFASIIAGTLGVAATESGDNIGLLLFSSDVELASDLSMDYYPVLQFLAMEENYGGEKDWGKFVRLMMGNYVGPNTIVFLVSDFIDSNPDVFLPELMNNVAKVYGIMIRDPIDNKLPAKVGRTYLKDTNGNRMYVTNLDKYREEYALMNEKQIEKIKDSFHSYDQLFFEMTTDQEFGTAFIEALGEEEVEIS